LCSPFKPLELLIFNYNTTLCLTITYGVEVLTELIPAQLMHMTLILSWPPLWTVC